MSTEETYERVYTGSEVNVQYLQELFNKSGISNRVRNDMESGLRAGFGGGVPGQVQLFAIKSHFNEAAAIVKSAFPSEVTKHE